MKLSCFIIDDEPLAIEVLEEYISQIESVEIEGTFGNAILAFEALNETDVDVLFLDIQMPKLTGVELLKTLKNPPKVIFTTAYREYALEGFELDVIDYLLKPISFERFLKAVNKVRDLSSVSSDDSALTQPEDNFIFVSSGNKKVKIRLSDILYLESKGDYVFIKTKKKEVTTHSTLTSMEKEFSSHAFLRIHRSFMVNLKNIESWSQTEIEVGNQKLPIGRTYKSQASKALEKL